MLKCNYLLQFIIAIIIHNCYDKYNCNFIVQGQIEARAERSTKLRDMLHLYKLGVVRDDGTLGPPATWIPKRPPLLGPALVGPETKLDFKADGSWRPLANVHPFAPVRSRKKSRKLLTSAPVPSTRAAIGLAVLRAVRTSVLTWTKPITYCKGLKMPIENLSLPEDDPDRYPPLVPKGQHILPASCAFPLHSIIAITIAILNCNYCAFMFTISLHILIAITNCNLQLQLL